MTYRCEMCAKPRAEQITFCPSCDEETDGFYEDGGYSDKDRDVDNYAKRFREPSVVEKINRAERDADRAKMIASTYHERQSSEWWATVVRECCNQGEL